MENKEILKKIEEQEKKLDKIYSSVEKTRKYFLYTFIATIFFILLPVIGLIFLIPRLLGLYADIFNF